ncbi:MAG: dTDP-glucose 4,6-dehydratase [Thermoplasmata archaeon]|nr:dTDP-glucose 4,6-dehydratase [Thermoplasmata archaeon]
MALLVTGGYGFIGSNYIRHLESIGYRGKVINVDKLGIGSNVDNLKGLNLDHKFLKLDLAAQNLPENEEIDYIVNFASETHVDRSIKNPEEFYRNNVESLFRILEWMRKSKNDVRMVHISTDEVYGEILEGSFTEESTLKPSNPYSATKASQDMFVLAYVRTYGLNISITRSANNYGPYQFPEKFIPKTIIRGMNNLDIIVYGSGKQIRSWLYVRDNAEAIHTVLLKGKKGEIYNIPGSDEVENIQIVKMIAKTMNRELKIRHVEDRPGHDLRYSLRGKNLEALGWMPKTRIADGLGLTVKWYMENEWWWKPLVNEKVLGVGFA